jgi:UDP-N-acetylglucosamine--N-acetylmuramyl-(pentapeptide) pyrophosphoryl-undecaprenol N-acetylglucosamine transferase
MKKIVVMAGGTGGHIFPGLSIAKELRDNYGYEVLWIGAKGYMEENIVPKHDIPLKLISIHGLRNKGVLRKFLAPFKILKAILDVRKILKEFNPNVVLGLGGFVSGPGGISAKLLGIPLVLHEQNATAGLTNRLLSKIANKVLLGFPRAIKSGVYVGNPIRKEIVQIHNELPKKFNEKVRISVVGGSLGAQALNNIVPHALAY